MLITAVLARVARAHSISSARSLAPTIQAPPWMYRYTDSTVGGRNTRAGKAAMVRSTASSTGLRVERANESDSTRISTGSRVETGGCPAAAWFMAALIAAVGS